MSPASSASTLQSTELSASAATQLSAISGVSPGHEPADSS